MILSASRRTDIPAHFSDWFFNRIKEGFAYVRNPINIYQISRIDLSPDVVDCIVFWTKNPLPMLDRLSGLQDYPYYFQYTLTPYGHDIESALPDKKSMLIPAFRKLSEQIGIHRVVWRYDPILLNPVYTIEYHLKAFAEYASALEGATDTVVISFIDFYAKTKRNMANLSIQTVPTDEILPFAAKLAAIAASHGMKMESCAEKIDLQSVGISHGSCIDKRRMEDIIGCGISVKRDKAQRAECGCMESIDIGTYHTCPNGCKYCYANFSDSNVKERLALYDAASPLLCGKIGENDKITKRKVGTVRIPAPNATGSCVKIQPTI